MNDQTLPAPPPTQPGIRVGLRVPRVLLVLMLLVPVGCETMMSRRHMSGDAALRAKSRFETSPAYDSQSQAAPAPATDRQTVEAARAQVLAFINQLEELDVEQPTGAVGRDDPPAADRTGDAAGGHEQVTSSDPLWDRLSSRSNDRLESLSHNWRAATLGALGRRPPKPTDCNPWAWGSLGRSRPGCFAYRFGRRGRHAHWRFSSLRSRPRRTRQSRAAQPTCPSTPPGRLVVNWGSMG